MTNNIAARNTYLILSIASWAGLIYFIIDTIISGKEWFSVAPMLVASGLLTRFYLCYRREVKRGNIYGRVNQFKWRNR